jgi:Mn-dependent DtxR family transcriptional regulator
MQATLTFSLPDEQGEYDAARLGRDALVALWEIDQHCRALLKHGSPSEETRELAEAIRAMISDELRDA